MSYAGDVTPAEAWEALSDDPAAVLVDVRTAAEWSYVGLPDLSRLAKDVVLVEWQTYPDRRRQRRLRRRASAAGDRRAGTRLLHLPLRCAIGGRRRGGHGCGWARSHNVLEGFEGPHDAEQHRTVSGWKVAGLPWVQG